MIFHVGISKASVAAIFESEGTKDSRIREFLFLNEPSAKTSRKRQSFMIFGCCERHKVDPEDGNFRRRGGWGSGYYTGTETRTAAPQGLMSVKPFVFSTIAL